MIYATQKLRNEYMEKAQDIGTNAINLVNGFFSPVCIADLVGDDIKYWTLTDLDRSLDAMRAEK